MTKMKWIVVLILVAACEAGDAQKNADQWAKSMGIAGPVVCAGQDSDGDGYVSCTFKDDKGVQAIECSTGRGACNAGGCRVPKLKAATE